MFSSFLGRGWYYSECPITLEVDKAKTSIQNRCNGCPILTNNANSNIPIALQSSQIDVSLNLKNTSLSALLDERSLKINYYISRDKDNDIETIEAETCLCNINNNNFTYSIPGNSSNTFHDSVQFVFNQNHSGLYYFIAEINFDNSLVEKIAFPIEIQNQNIRSAKALNGYELIIRKVDGTIYNQKIVRNQIEEDNIKLSLPEGLYFMTIRFWSFSILILKLD